MLVEYVGVMLLEYMGGTLVGGVWLGLLQHSPPAGWLVSDTHWPPGPGLGASSLSGVVAPPRCGLLWGPREGRGPWGFSQKDTDSITAPPPHPF